MGGTGKRAHCSSAAQDTRCEVYVINFYKIHSVTTTNGKMMRNETKHKWSLTVRSRLQFGCLKLTTHWWKVRVRFMYLSVAMESWNTILHNPGLLHQYFMDQENVINRRVWSGSKAEWDSSSPPFLFCFFLLSFPLSHTLHEVLARCDQIIEC